MENILLNDSNQIYEMLSYFSCELFYIAGIILNLAIFLFFKRKQGTKRLSNTITAGVFFINILILLAIYIKSTMTFGGFDFSLLNGFLRLNSFSFTVNLFINIFMLMFLISTYRIIKKIHLKTSVINACLILIALVSSILVTLDNFIFSYILVDVLTILIYKYACSMVIRRYTVYSKNYILLGTVSSVLFILFYSLFIIFSKNPVQTDILKVCMTIALLLKIGIFPIYNYQITKGYKDNIPYSILLFCYLPWMGILTFNKISGYITSANEIYQIPITVFLCFAMISFSLFSIKQKNIIKFLANIFCLVNIFCIMHIIYFSGQSNYGVELVTGFCFVVAAFYSTTCILKINTDFDKINIKAYEGLFYNNGWFAAVTSFILSVSCFVFPSCNLKYVINMLKDIYTYDKTGIYVVFAFLVSTSFVLFKTFEIIKSIYTLDRANIKEKFTKRATSLYVAPLLVISFIIIKIFF